MSLVGAKLALGVCHQWPGVAEGRALAQSRRRRWARTPHEDSLRGHTGHAGQMLDSTQGDISLPSGHPRPGTACCWRDGHPHGPSRGDCVPCLGAAEPTAGPSWPSVLTQSKVPGTETRAQCSRGGEVGQRPAPTGDQAHPAPGQVHGCSWAQAGPRGDSYVTATQEVRFLPPRAFSLKHSSLQNHTEDKG